MSELQVNKISPQSGTAITLGDSGDTFTIPSGATITNNGTANNFGSEYANVQYSCGVWKATEASIADSTWTKWDTSGGTELWDKGNIMNLTNSRITVPSDAAGIWMFKVAVKNQNYTTSRMLIRMYKNGSSTEALGGTQEIGNFSSGSYPTCQLIHYFNLAAGDYMEPYVRQSSGSGQTLYDFFYSGTYLGSAT